MAEAGRFYVRGPGSEESAREGRSDRTRRVRTEAEMHSTEHDYSVDRFVQHRVVALLAWFSCVTEA